MAKILFQDEAILVVNKPAGVVVCPPAPGHTTTLVQQLQATQALPVLSAALRSGVVHRLDKDTTGVLVFAKTTQAWPKLLQQVRSCTMSRVYLTVVHGVIHATSGTIQAPLAKYRTRQHKMLQQINPMTGRVAVTHYWVLARTVHHTLLKIQLVTGRTHQIRAHCQYLQHPLVGDRDYATQQYSSDQYDTYYLHAWKLTINHPITTRTLTWTAPLPRRFCQLLSVLQFSVTASDLKNC